jgi:hypothetical protein
MTKVPASEGPFGDDTSRIMWGPSEEPSSSQVSGPMVRELCNGDTGTLPPQLREPYG